MILKSLDKEIPEINKVYCYELIVDFITNDAFGVICSYGLHVYEKDCTSSKYTDIVCKSISTNFTLVRNLYEKIVNDEVLPVHIKDVIEDEFKSLHDSGYIVI